MTSFQEACAMFKVGDNTTWKEVKARYHALALKHHPDKGGLKEFFQRVLAAYELLDAHFKTNKTLVDAMGDVQCATSTNEEWTEDECFKQSNMTEAEFQEFLSRQKEEESFARQMKKKEAEREKAYFDSLKTDAEKQRYKLEQESSRLQAWVIGRENHDRMLRDLISQNKPTAHIPAYSHGLPVFKDSSFMNASAAETMPSKEKAKKGKVKQNHQRNAKRKHRDGSSRKLTSRTSVETEKEGRENNKRIANRCSSNMFNNDELPPKAKSGTKKPVPLHPLTIDEDDEEQEIQFEQLGAKVLDSSTEQHIHRRNTQQQQHVGASSYYLEDTSSANDMAGAATDLLLFTRAASNAAEEQSFAVAKKLAKEQNPNEKQTMADAKKPAAEQTPPKNDTQQQVSATLNNSQAKVKISKRVMTALRDVVVPNQTSTSFRLKEVIEVATGTRVSDLMLRMELYISIMFLNKEADSDNLFDYDQLQNNCSSFLTSVFDKEERGDISNAMYLNNTTVLLAIHCQPGHKVTQNGVICALVFQQLQDPPGMYVSYIATQMGLYNCNYPGLPDLQPWRQRGIGATLLSIASNFSCLLSGSNYAYLQCQGDAVMAYRTMGFHEIATINAPSLYPSSTDELFSIIQRNPELHTMAISTVPITRKAATPTYLSNNGTRACCRNAAFRDKPEDFLFECDKVRFLNFDVYQGSTFNSYYAYCSLCGEYGSSCPFDDFLATEYYDFVTKHSRVCNLLSLSSKERLDYMPVEIDGQHPKIKNRVSWLAEYMLAIRETACLDGCGKVIDNVVHDFDVSDVNNNLDCSDFNCETRIATRSSRRMQRNTLKALQEKQVPKKITDKTQLAKLIFDNRWWGMYTCGKRQRLSDVFVQDNFTAAFRNVCRNNMGKPQTVNASAPKSHHLTTSHSTPPVYLQYFRDTCLMTSFASALRYLNDDRAHKVVCQNILRSENEQDRFKFAEQVIKANKLKYQVRQFKNRQLNIFQSLSCYPTTLRLAGEDGSINHAVSTAGKWLFDSNMTNAQEISLPLLDWCCSSNTERTKFSHVVYAQRLYTFKPRPEWTLCDGCMNNSSCLVKL